MASKRILLAVLLLNFFILSSLAAAESPLKIGMVNIQTALNQVEQGKKAKENLKKEFEARQKKLDLQQDELKKMQEELEKKRLVLSQSDMKEKEEKFTQKYMELQKNFAAYQKEIVEREGQFTAKIVANLRTICEEIGKKEGYDLVVETSQGSVLYAGKAEDITERVVTIYNKKYKGDLAL